MKLLLSSLLLLLGPTTTLATDHNYNLQKHINQEPDDILQNLSQYSKLFISVPKHSSHMLGTGYGNCVWSECGLDDQTDDMQMGDNRDGDGRWYRFRTQSFCANAAFTLYGVKKGGMTWGGGCTKRNFINSFFTYDGADNLLKAVGVTPQRYYEEYGERRRRRMQEDDDDAEEKEPVEHDYGNANCVQLDNYNGNNNNNNGNGNERNLQSGDNVQDGYSSALGCDSKGNYIMAAFQGGNCNGNYFLDSIDSMDAYNEEFGNIGCHEIYTNSGSNNNEDYTNEAIYTLLRDSWACDTKLYPHACPDPYGEKSIDEFALHSAAHGGNGLLAYRSQKAQRAINILSVFFLIGAACMSTVAYYLRNRGRIQKEGTKTTVKKDAGGLFGKKSKKGEIEMQDKSGDGYKVPGGVVA